MAEPAIQYLVFDVETATDGALVSRIRYADEKLSPEKAIAKYRAELMERHDSDFVPYTFQIPCAIAIGKVTAEYKLVDLVVLDEPQFRPHIITENFWRGWEKYRRPTLVSFNGRTFDLPMLELAAYRYGLALPGWFNLTAKSFEQFRNRFNLDAHIDLQELLTNFGATRFTGGLNLAASLVGRPGKMDVSGDMVQDLFLAGKLSEINDYCRCDVLDTYFVFLRTRVLMGDLTLSDEQRLTEETRRWLQSRAEQTHAIKLYLDRWGSWESPWESSEPAPAVKPKLKWEK